MTTEKLLTTNEAADVLGVSRNRVLQLIDAGTITASKLGRDYAIPESALKGVQVYGKAGRPPLKASASSKRRAVPLARKKR
jgi:excisionase family DNA binding protein